MFFSPKESVFTRKNWLPSSWLYAQRDWPIAIWCWSRVSIRRAANGFPKEEGIKLLRPGEIVFCVYDRESTNEPNRLVAASVGVAIPADQEQHGYLSEHHSFGETEERAGEYAEDLAASMLATTLGIEFDPDTAWDERENLFKMSGKIVRTSNITQSAIGNKDGLWTTVFAACAFVNEDS
jgi:arginine decarboxylase